MSTDSPSVAVIGAGYAGTAAAITLAQAGIPCRLYETGKEPGGRARRIHYRDTALDNGQHILIGAYRELLGMMRTVGVPETHYERIPLAMKLHPDFELRAPKLPAPLHLAWALFTARGLTFGDRIAAIRFARHIKNATVDERANVAALLREYGQSEALVTNLWAPLCIAALNTPLERASAKVFVTVLRDALFHAREDSDFVLPKVDLTSLFPEPAIKWLSANGATVERGSRVTRIDPIDASFDLTSAHGATHRHTAVICAVGPHQLEAIGSNNAVLQQALRPDRPARFEPIYTAYLQYPPATTLPSVMLGRQSGMAQWFFDRGTLCGQAGLIAAVISASGPHEALDHAAVAQAAHRELEELTGPLPEPLWHKVVAEQFATFACEPGTPRPACATTTPGLFLAGDYTEGPYPSTLEGAVRSGQRAARLTTQYLRQ